MLGKYFYIVKHFHIPRWLTIIGDMCVPFLAQDIMAGYGVGISEELISLEVTSADVPDLTLIDLPGIASVAVKGQPDNIGEKVKANTRWYKPGIHCFANDEITR